MVRELVKEICGLMPYEKRLLDMIKTGGSSSEKRMYKFAKLRVREIFLEFANFYLHFSLELTNEQLKRDRK